MKSTTTSKLSYNGYATIAYLFKITFGHFMKTIILTTNTHMTKIKLNIFSKRYHAKSTGKRCNFI